MVQYHTFDHELHKEKFKIGVFGLCDESWLRNMGHLDETLLVLDFNKTAVKMAKMLKDVEKCNYVIALTHMRAE